MPKTAVSIQAKEFHRREYQRTMRRIVGGSILLWFVMAVVLANNESAGILVPVSIAMMIGLAITRVVMWSRYRLHMRADLQGQGENRM